MLIKRRAVGELCDRDVTDEAIYLRRREFLRLGVAGAAALALPGCSHGEDPPPSSPRPATSAGPPRQFDGLTRSSLSTDEAMTPFGDASSYNNFYEFGTDKSDPSRYAGSLITRPWNVRIDGLVARPGEYHLEDVLGGVAPEERIYRLRCVEAWSMVIPWVGIPLASVLKRYEPTSAAKYVGFKTLYAPEQMPGQNTSVLRWPYQEGLRLDEAMHPLTILAIGMYGRELPNQNGAPLRLVVPWKYGFKSIKSIVSIELTDREPVTSWNQAAPREYGFYSNVNPEVDHPRWSQSKERRLGELLRRPTLPFNGYGEQVASLYAGMDLTRFF